MSDSEMAEAARRLADATWQVRVAHRTVLKVGTLVSAVELLALVVMAWRHESDALIGPVLGLLLTLGAMLSSAYRLGRDSRATP